MGRHYLTPRSFSSVRIVFSTIMSCLTRVFYRIKIESVETLGSFNFNESYFSKLQDIVLASSRIWARSNTEIKYSTTFSILYAAFCFGVFRLYHHRPDYLSGVGQVIGAATSGFAFIWIFASLQAQRAQIKSQNAAIELQAQQIADARQATEINSDFLKINLFISLLNHYQLSLSRICKSFVHILGFFSEEVEDVISKSDQDIEAIAYFLANDPQIKDRLLKHHQNPIFQSLGSNYLHIYQTMITLGQNEEFHLAKITMSNSSFNHFASLLSALPNLYQSNYVNDGLTERIKT